MPALFVDWCPDDNCPDVFNPCQTDSDLDGVGDACCCAQRGDVDHATKASIDIADFVWLVDYMFTGGPAPPPCP